MTVQNFVSEERDLLITLLCLTGVKLTVTLADDARLRLSSIDLAEREIHKISLYARDLELVSNRLNTLGYELAGYEDDRAIFEKSLKYISILEVGDLIQLRTPWGNTPAGSRCLVYEIYKIGESLGVSLISEDGNDLGGFNQVEQGKYLILLKRTGFKYTFKSVNELSSDYDYGMFDKAFEV